MSTDISLEHGDTENTENTDKQQALFTKSQRGRIKKESKQLYKKPTKEYKRFGCSLKTELPSTTFHALAKYTACWPFRDQDIPCGCKLKMCLLVNLGFSVFLKASTVLFWLHLKHCLSCIPYDFNLSKTKVRESHILKHDISAIHVPSTYSRDKFYLLQRQTFSQTF